MQSAGVNVKPQSRRGRPREAKLPFEQEELEMAMAISASMVEKEPARCGAGSGHGGGGGGTEGGGEGVGEGVGEGGGESGGEGCGEGGGGERGGGAEPAAKRCRNMGLQLREYVPVLIGPSRVSGWGAFAPHAIEKGDLLLEYLGELISHGEADRRGKVYDRRASSYLFNLNDMQVVDAGRMGNRSRFVNHDDSPNARTRIMTVRGDHHIGMYAAAPIAAGEEICFDYRYDRDERRKYRFEDDAQDSAREDGALSLAAGAPGRGAHGRKRGRPRKRPRDVDAEAARGRRPSD